MALVFLDDKSLILDGTLFVNIGPQPLGDFLVGDLIGGYLPSFGPFRVTMVARSSENYINIKYSSIEGRGDIYCDESWSGAPTTEDTRWIPREFTFTITEMELP